MESRIGLYLLRIWFSCWLPEIFNSLFSFLYVYVSSSDIFLIIIYLHSKKLVWQELELGLIQTQWHRSQCRGRHCTRVRSTWVKRWIELRCGWARDAHDGWKWNALVWGGVISEADLRVVIFKAYFNMFCVYMCDLLLRNGNWICWIATCLYK